MIKEVLKKYKSFSHNNSDERDLFLNNLKKDLFNLNFEEVFIPFEKQQEEKANSILLTHNIILNNKIYLDIIDSNILQSEYDSESNIFVKDFNLLNSSIGSVYNSYYQKNLDIISEIFYRLLNNHPFSNGNKRLALIGTLVGINYKNDYNNCLKNIELYYLLTLYICVNNDKENSIKVIKSILIDYILSI